MLNQMMKLGARALALSILSVGFFQAPIHAQANGGAGPHRIVNILPAALEATLNQSAGFTIPRDTLSFQFEIQDSEGLSAMPGFQMVYGGDMVDPFVRGDWNVEPGTGSGCRDFQTCWREGCSTDGKCLPGHRVMIRGQVSPDSIHLSLEIFTGEAEGGQPILLSMQASVNPRFAAFNPWHGGDEFSIQAGADHLYLRNGPALSIVPNAGKAAPVRFSDGRGTGTQTGRFDLSGRRVAGALKSRKIIRLEPMRPMM